MAQLAAARSAPQGLAVSEGHVASRSPSQFM